MSYEPRITIVLGALLVFAAIFAIVCLVLAFGFFIVNVLFAPKTEAGHLKARFPFWIFPVAALTATVLSPAILYFDRYRWPPGAQQDAFLATLVFGFGSIAVFLNLKLSKRFSLRGLATVIAFLSLLAWVFASFTQTQQLKQRLHDLKESHGSVTQDLYYKTGDCWELVPLGNDYRVNDTYLLRVRNYEKYRLRLHFFNGVSNQYQTTTHEFVANETVVRYFPGRKKIVAHDTTWPIDNQTDFEFDGELKFFEFCPEGHDIISDETVVGFKMRTPETLPHGLLSYRLRSPGTLKSACSEFKLKFAWITIEERP